MGFFRNIACRCPAPGLFLLGLGPLALAAALGSETPLKLAAWLASLCAAVILAAVVTEAFIVPSVENQVLLEKYRRADAAAGALLVMSGISAALGAAVLWDAGIIWISRVPVNEMLKMLPSGIENNRLSGAVPSSLEASRLVEAPGVTGLPSPFTDCGWGEVITAAVDEGPTEVKLLTSSRSGRASAILTREGCKTAVVRADIEFRAVVTVSLTGGEDNVAVGVTGYTSRLLPLAKGTSR